MTPDDLITWQTERLLSDFKAAKALEISSSTLRKYKAKGKCRLRIPSHIEARCAEIKIVIQQDRHEAKLAAYCHKFFKEAQVGIRHSGANSGGRFNDYGSKS